MSALHEELTSDPRRHQATQCRLCQFLDTLDPVVRSDWTEELRQPTSVVSHISVERALKRRQVVASWHSVKRHRENHT